MFTIGIIQRDKFKEMKGAGQQIGDLPSKGVKLKSIVLYLLMFYFIGISILQITNGVKGDAKRESMHCVDLHCQTEITALTNTTQYLFLVVGTPMLGMENAFDAPIQCGSYTTNEQMGKTNSLLNSSLIANQTAIPCGWTAFTFPNFAVSIMSGNETYGVNSTGLAYNNDIQHIELNESKAWVDPRSQFYRVWSEDNSLFNTLKFVGVIPPLEKYTLRFQCRDKHYIVKENIPLVYKDKIEIQLKDQVSMKEEPLNRIIINLLFALSFAVMSRVYFLLVPKEKITVAGNEERNQNSQSSNREKDRNLKENQSEQTSLQIVVRVKQHNYQTEQINSLLKEIQSLRRQIYKT